MAGESGQIPLDHGGPTDHPYEPWPAAVLDGSICDRFEAIARRYPDRLAIQDLDRALSYAELSARVEAVAAHVRAALADRPGPVAILLPNDARYPAAMLGVLAAGRAFVPLDADHPVERNRQIAAHATAAAVIAAADSARELRTLFASDLPVVDVEAIGDVPSDGARHRIGPDDLAAIFYTSGSSGTPKGVCHIHRSILHGIRQWTDAMHLGCNDRVAHVGSPSNYVGARTILFALLNGAGLHVLPVQSLTPAGLAREIRARGITVYRSVPTIFRHLVEALGEDERLDSLRLVYLGGDRIEWSDYDDVRRSCPADTTFAVGLASTEATNFAWWYVDGHLRETASQLPVGRAVGDPSILLVDSEGRAVADGEVGEIVVRGRHLSTGYWREPELTAHAFASDPIDPEIRIYRTGDLGRRRPDGLFEFIGRKDDMVKLHGQRIELGEIEATLAECAPLREAAVLVRRDKDGTPLSIVAYVELEPGVVGLTPRHIQAMVSQRLPHHMVPSLIFFVDTLPRLPNFKLDRKVLAQHDAARATKGSDQFSDSLTREVATIFERVLGVAGATPEDNVASLGGDSLRAIDVAAELERHFGVPVPAEAFDDSQTIASLAALIASRRQQQSDPV